MEGEIGKIGILLFRGVVVIFETARVQMKLYIH